MFNSNTNVPARKLAGTSRFICLFLAVILSVSTLLCALSALTGCSCASSSTVKDMGDYTVSIKADSKKIVSLWPAMTSSMIALGLGDKIVGVSSNDEADINDWAKTICPSIKDAKSFSAITPSADDIQALDADFVILNPESLSKGYQKELSDAGITAINLKYTNYDEMGQALTILGKFLDSNSQKKIDNYNKMLQEKLPRIYDSIDKDNVQNNIIINYIPGDSDDVLRIRPVNSVVNDWIRYNTGQHIGSYCNIADDATSISPSDFSAAGAIFIGGPYKKSVLAEINSNDIWAQALAVQTNQIFFAPTGVSPWGDIGVESYLMLDFALVKCQDSLASHNNTTIDDVKQQAIDFYRDYSGISLTSDQVEYMFNSLDPTGTKSLEKQSRFTY